MLHRFRSADKADAKDNDQHLSDPEEAMDIRLFVGKNETHQHEA